MIFRLAIALLATGLLGCGTIITKIDGAKTFDDKEISPIYSGTRFAIGGAQLSPVYFVWVIDVPLSFAADTALLPVSILQVIGGAIGDSFFPEEETIVIEPEATESPESEGP
jgi:uncharacterized protein YceK